MFRLASFWFTGLTLKPKPPSAGSSPLIKMRHFAKAVCILLLSITFLSFTFSMAVKKRILVTGGNKGIGKAICERLLKEYPDTFVFLGSRDTKRGEQAVSDIVKTLGDGVKARIATLQIDTSSDDSVKAAASSIASQEPLYGIINNAGVGWGYSFEDTVNTNYFGPRRVNEAFKPLLKRPGARIVNVASASGPNFLEACSDAELKEKLSKPWTIKGGLAELDSIAKTMQSDNAYGASKALLNAYTVMEGKVEKDIVVNSCTPGFIATDLTAGMSASNTPDKGAVPPCWLLMEDDVLQNPAGRYYGSDCVRSPISFYRGPGEPPYENDEDVVELPASMLVV